MKDTRTSHTYKNLIVYQKSQELALALFQVFSNLKLSNNYGFIINQLLRSSSSIGANIAEGYGRHYTKSYRQHLAIARGSSFETDYWLDIMLKLKIIPSNKLNNLINLNQEISKMLTTLMKKLK